jgi:hypothetical protein
VLKARLEISLKVFLKAGLVFGGRLVVFVKA